MPPKAAPQPPPPNSQDVTTSSPLPTTPKPYAHILQPVPGTNKIKKIPTAGLTAARQMLLSTTRAPLSRAVRKSNPITPLTIRKAAAQYGGSKSSIARHLRALKETNEPYFSDKLPGRPRAITSAENEALLDFCRSLPVNLLGNTALIRLAVNELRARRKPFPEGPVHNRYVARWIKEQPELMAGEQGGEEGRAGKRVVESRKVDFELSEEGVRGWFDRYERDRGTVGGDGEGTVVVSVDGVRRVDGSGRVVDGFTRGLGDGYVDGTGNGYGAGTGDAA